MPGHQRPSGTRGPQQGRASLWEPDNKGKSRPVPLDRRSTMVPNRLGGAAYHRAILRALGVDGPSHALLSEPVGPAAGPYPEVREALTQLRDRGVPLDS